MKELYSIQYKIDDLNKQLEDVRNNLIENKIDECASMIQSLGNIDETNLKLILRNLCSEVKTIHGIK